MIKFGKTHEEKRKIQMEEYNKEQARRKTLMNGVKKFAWWPVQIDTGEYVWLTKYYQYYSACIMSEQKVYFVTKSNNKPVIRNYLNEDPNYIGAFDY
jgi:hypothetical protein